MTTIPTYNDIPALGYGTFRRQGEEAKRCVLHALSVGYRHIDTAVFYENEREVGQALKESGLSRDDLFVTTKVWHDHLAEGQVRSSAMASLDRLGLDHVDLLLIHWPAPEDVVPVAQYMEEIATLKAEGLTKKIGVSNFTKRHIDEAIAAVGAGEIATNQCELNIYFQNRPIAEYCGERGIPITAYQPLALGKVSDDTTLARIARRHDATEAQVALAWLLAKGYITIPSSSNEHRIEENFRAADISLTMGDITDLDRLDTASRKVQPEWSPEWDQYEAA